MTMNENTLQLIHILIVYITYINVCPEIFFNYLMNILLITGTIMITIAFISYTLAIIFEQRKQIASVIFVAFLFLGFLLDFVSTLLMITGSKNGPVSFHGFLGYSSLLGMLVACLLILRIIKDKGYRSIISKTVHIYTNVAYIWWVISYITGAVIGMTHKF